VPKRPRTAYNLFFRDQQEKISIMKQHDPTSSNSAAAVSVSWKELPPNEKAKYFQMAADDKFRYYNEKTEYINNSMKNSVDGEKYGSTRGKAMEPSANLKCEETNPTPYHPDEQSSSRKDAAHGHDTLLLRDDGVPFYSRESIALLASKLDAKSIDFIIKVFK